LKKILKTKGLSVAGSKTELIERLSSVSETLAEKLIDETTIGDAECFDEDLDGELDETELMADEKEVTQKEDKPVEETPKPEGEKVEEAEKSTAAAPSEAKEEPTLNSSENKAGGEEKKKVIKLVDIKNGPSKISLKPTTIEANETSKKLARAVRFGIKAQITTKQPDAEDPLKKRAARFNKTTDKVGAVADAAQAELLKRRAERFGISSPVDAKKQMLDKMNARKARFGAATVATNGKKEVAVDEKKKLREERFKIAT